MEKLNIAEILKDCPKGMELDCVMYDNVSFDKVSDDEKAVYPIFCYITDEKGNRSGISFTENGYESKRYGAKCVIFPKGKTTWEGFQKPFKDGDVVVDTLGGIHIMRNASTSYCYFDRLGILDKTETSCVRVDHLATEEEKQKLFDAIKANGYKWNAETKTLEKLIDPKFKVGDRVRYKDDTTVITITGIKDDYYFIQFYNPKKNDYQTERFLFKYQDDWVLVPNKFDITTLKPFDNCKYSLDKGRTWKFAQYWYIQDNHNVNDIEIELWQD